MAVEPDPLFEAHLHPQGVTDQDLESMRFFGVTAALVAADHSPLHSNAQTLLEHFDDIVEKQLPRLERAGIRGYAALGIHPRALPRRGLAEVLSALPGYFRGGKVVAIGEIGLLLGGGAEEEAFVEQLALARRLKLRALVYSPKKDKERLTRRTLNLIRDSKLPPQRALVDHASPRTVRLVLECGHYVGFNLHPEELASDEALALVRKLGSDRVVVGTDSGHGASDIVALARFASQLLRSGLSEKIAFRVVRDNAARFYGLSGL